MPNHEIKTIVAELQSMSPRTQLEIVRLCKKVAELTPDYIDTLSAETKAELQPLIDANADAIAANTELINQEVTDRKAIVENVDNIIEGVSVNENKLKSSGTSEFAGVYVNDTLTSVTNENEVEMTTPAFTFNADSQKAEMKSLLNDESVKIENHEITITNNSHTLKLDASGNLTLDGLPVSGGGDISLYQHNLRIRNSQNTDTFSMTIITSDSTPFTFTTFENYFISNEINSESKAKMCNGYFVTPNNELAFYNSIWRPSNSYYSFRYFKLDGTNTTTTPTISATWTFNDKVIQIS